MKTLIALAVSGLLATGAMAGGDKDKMAHEKKDAQARFVELDVDSSATLTQAEAASAMELREQDFMAADTDQDGELSLDEFAAWSEAAEAGDKQYSAGEVEEDYMGEDAIETEEEAIEEIEKDDEEY